jgi:phosphatidylinositol glycan class O
MHVRYKKAVIIVIDALRYDFVAFDSSEDSSLHYKNKFTVIQNHLRKPNNAKLYKFIADPPTTTLQRLKGLTTGSLPTFALFSMHITLHRKVNLTTAVSFYNHPF